MTDPERGPEGLEELGQYLEFVRQHFDPELDRIAAALKLPADDVAKLAVILLGQHLDMTNDPDVLVLVIRGSLTPYDTALEALLSNGPGDGRYAGLVGRLNAASEDEA